MNWIMKHESNGISTDNYHYSGEIIGDWISAHCVFNINYYLKELRIRVGPVFDEQDRIVGLGRYYRGTNSKMSLREALEKL